MLITFNINTFNILILSYISYMIFLLKKIKMVVILKI